MNERDVCEPYGMYNGIDSKGYIRCISKNNSNAYYPLDYYNKDAVLVTTNPILSTEPSRLY